MKKKALLGSILLIAALLLFFAFQTYREAEYRILYTNLTPEDYITLSDWLELRDVEFKTDKNRRSIYVSADRIHQTRLEMAQYKLPRDLENGKDLIDASQPAVIDAITAGDPSVALQLELAKTIASLDHIQSARVHISYPSADYSVDDGPSATVLLTQTPGRSLTTSQLQGVLHLLSASVSGLQPNKIRIFDSAGSLLTTAGGYGAAHLFPGGSLAYQAAVENSLENKAQKLIDAMIGEGQALIKVAAELDFARNETTSERYDPEEPVVKSEHIQQEPAADSGAGANNTFESSLDTGVPRYQPSVTTSSRFDYEINKTVSKTIQPAGGIKQLTVTLLVGDNKSLEPDGSFSFYPRSDEELDSIKSLVSAALSLNPERGDSIQLMRTPSYSSLDGFPPQKTSLLYDLLNLFPVGRIAFIAFVFLLFHFLVLKPMIVLLKSEIDPSGNEAVDDQQAEDFESEPAAEQEDLVSILKNEIENNPVAAAHVIKRWIQET